MSFQLRQQQWSFNKQIYKILHSWQGRKGSSTVWFQTELHQYLWFMCKSTPWLQHSVLSGNNHRITDWSGLEWESSTWKSMEEIYRLSQTPSFQGKVHLHSKSCSIFIWLEFLFKLLHVQGIFCLKMHFSPYLLLIKRHLPCLRSDDLLLATSG